MATKIEMEAFEKETQDVREAIRKIANRKRPPGVAAVTHDERLHFTPARDEFEQLVPTLRDLVEETGIQLPKYKMTALDESLAVVKTLQPLLEEIENGIGGLEGAVRDTIDLHRSQAYRIFVKCYSALAGVANEEGDWQTKYDALVELFAHGKRKAEPKPEPKPEVTTPKNEDVETPVKKVG